MALLSGDHIVVKMDDSGGTLRTFENGDLIGVDPGLMVKQFNVAGFGDEVEKYINGQMQAPVTIRGYFTTTPLVGTHTVINSAFVNGTQVSLVIQVGNNAAPVNGDPEFRGEFLVESYRPTIANGGAIGFTATLKPATSDAPYWTVVGA